MTRLTLAAFLAVGVLCSSAHGLDFQYAKQFVSGVIDKASNFVGKQKQIDPPIDFFTYSSRTNSPETPIVCEEDGLFAHPSDCTSYTRCTDGVYTVVPCPDELHFNTESRQCEESCSAHCDETLACSCGWDSCEITERTTDEYYTTESSTENSKRRYTLKVKFVCPEDGMFAVDGDCSELIHCHDNVPYVKSCPPGLHFSNETRTCELPCTAKCDPTIPCKWKEFKKTVSKLIPKDITCEGDERLPNPEDCSTFIQCFNGVPYVKSCPGLLHFNQTTLVCEDPCRALCDPRIQDCGWIDSSPARKASLKQPVFDFTCVEDGLFENSLVCENFIQCVGGSAYLIDCPYGQHYSVAAQRCTSPCEAQCVPNYAEYCKDEENSNASKRRLMDFSCETDGYHVNPLDCQSFVQCFDGMAYAIYCPSGLHYSPERQICVRPCDARCAPNYEDFCREDERRRRRPDFPFINQRSILKQIPTTDFICPEEGMYPYPEDCNYYIECLNGHSSVLPCPNGGHFRKETRKCDSPCEARCDPDPSLARFCDYDNPHYEERWPKFDWICIRDELMKYGDCKSYIECLDGKAYIFPCPDELQFDDDTRTCVHPCQAKCDPSFAAVCGFDPEAARRRLHSPNPENPAFSYEMLTSTESSSSLAYGFPCISDGMYQHPEDCSYYIQCSGGHAYTMPCPEGLHFNQTTQRCETPCDARCSSDLDCDWLESSHKLEPTEEIDCEVEPETGPCKAGLPRYYYDVDSGRCRTFYYGGCNGNTNNFRTEDECIEKCQKKLLGGFRCPSFTGKFGHYPDCMSYYHCKRGIPTLKRCPKGTAFDHKKSKCVTEYDATCVYECRDRDAAYTFEEDCHKYIDCVNGVSKLEKCPPGKAFHPDEKDCVEKERVSACSWH